jgi:hypothetical protein
MLLVVVVLPLCLSMYDGELDHGGGGGGGGGGGLVVVAVAAVAAAVVAVEDNYQQKRLAMRASTVHAGMR